MADIWNQVKRSEVMSRIKSRGNKGTELRMIHVFRSNMITRWQRASKLPGKPDFVFLKQKLAMFVDGCFWHGCPKHGTQPKQNSKYWREKIARNKARDRKANRLLRARGWSVLRI